MNHKPQFVPIHKNKKVSDTHTENVAGTSRVSPHFSCALIALLPLMGVKATGRDALKGSVSTALIAENDT